MRTWIVVFLAGAFVSLPALAELQSVQVGGKIRIRGNSYSRSSGFTAPFGSFDNASRNRFVEQRTQLNVNADFSNDISMFVEVDSYDIWGEDFRSDFVTGFDFSATTTSDVEIYQAYIEMREVFDWPVQVRIGRQELEFGSEWLIGNNDNGSFFQGLSFDGIRATYGHDVWSVDAFLTKLQDNSPIEEDGDVDFYGIYGSYKGFEDITIDAYYLFLRDGRGSDLGFPFDTSNAGLLGRAQDYVEDFFGVDQYNYSTKIHTFGARIGGTWRGFDFEAEVAWQRQEPTNQVITFFSPDPATSMGTPYGDDAESNNRMGVNAVLGYTFDIAWSPRVYAGYAWFEGEDRREESFGDWLHTFYPFHQTDASVSFNRLFSNWEYSEFFDNSDLSNAHVIRGGVGAQPTEKISALLAASYFLADVPTTFNGVFGVPFWTKESDDSLGLELGLYLTYDYSEDLTFSAGYAHFFSEDGVGGLDTFLPRFFPKIGGNFVVGNGFVRLGGVDDEDADYVFGEAQIKF